MERIDLFVALTGDRMPELIAPVSEISVMVFGAHDGQTLWRHPLNGNPDFVKGNRRGAGREDLFWYKFRMADEGKGVLSCKQDTDHDVRFHGYQDRQVIAPGGYRLLGYRGQRRRP